MSSIDDTENCTEKYKEKFGDLWFRARHNALANMEASIDARKSARNWEILISILIVFPIYAYTLSSVFKEYSDSIILISALCSTGALFLTLVGFIQENKTNLNYHSRAHSIFNNIAQKARRGSNPALCEDELKYLIRSLEEMFETAKNNTSEPSDAHYNKGLQRMKNMPRWPFGLVNNNEG